MFLQVAGAISKRPQVNVLPQDPLYRRVIPTAAYPVVVRRDSLQRLSEDLGKQQHGRTQAGSADNHAAQRKQVRQIGRDYGNLIVAAILQPGSAEQGKAGHRPLQAHIAGIRLPVAKTEVAGQTVKRQSFFGDFPEVERQPARQAGQTEHPQHAATTRIQCRYFALLRLHAYRSIGPGQEVSGRRPYPICRQLHPAPITGNAWGITQLLQRGGHIGSFQDQVQPSQLLSALFIGSQPCRAALGREGRRIGSKPIDAQPARGFLVTGPDLPKAHVSNLEITQQNFPRRQATRVRRRRGLGVRTAQSQPVQIRQQLRALRIGARPKDAALCGLARKLHQPAVGTGAYADRLILESASQRVQLARRNIHRPGQLKRVLPACEQAGPLRRPQPIHPAIHE